MKRIAMAVAIVVMAAGACKKAQNSNADTMRADTMKMADSTKMMAPADTTHHMMADTAKAHPAAPTPAARPATKRPTTTRRP
jgi:pyridoxal biosynthesis lyase PdxS